MTKAGIRGHQSASTGGQLLLSLSYRQPPPGWNPKGMALTAANIRKYAQEKKTKSVKKPNSMIDIISTNYKTAVMAMLEQIRLAQNDAWQSTSKQAALFWLKVMKEKIIHHERHRP